MDPEERFPSEVLLEKLVAEVEDLDWEIAAYDKDIEDMVRARQEAAHRRDVLTRCGSVVARVLKGDLERQAKEEAERKAMAEAERESKEEAKAQKTPEKVSWGRKRPRMSRNDVDSN